MCDIHWDETRWVELSREELFDLVWSRPIVQLAPEFLITGAALGKRCRQTTASCRQTRVSRARAGP